MYKILIADASEVFCQSVSAKLPPQQFQIHTCRKAEALACALQKVRPDILIMDWMLAGVDSMFILEAAEEAGINPQTVVVGTYLDEHMLQQLCKLNVRAFFEKPCKTHQLAEKVISLAAEMEQALQICIEAVARYERRVELFLQRLGFYPYLNGYKMVAAGICFWMEHPNCSMTKELYPAVAQMWNVQWKQTEHAIRNCIASAYKRRNDWIWRLYFPCDHTGKVGHLANTAFISCVAKYLLNTDPVRTGDLQIHMG